MHVDNPWLIHLKPQTAYRQRTFLERMGQRLRAFWFRSDLLRLCVGWAIVGLALWSICIVATVCLIEWIR